MRLIDADALKELMIDVLTRIKNNPKMDGQERHVIAAISMLGQMIDDAPTIEERKTGRWIDAVLPNDNGGLPVQVCDQCNTFFPLAYTGGGHRFCPNCGADMREVQP